MKSANMSRLLLIALCLTLTCVTSIRAVTIDSLLATMDEELSKANRQLLMLQFAMEERVRSSGHSGLKKVRQFSVGDRLYQSSSHADSSMLAAMHDHPGQGFTVGLGEVVAVLNGVEFRTRHNDYLLRSRHSTDTSHGVFEDIPMPAVPPAVSALSQVSDQVNEMQQWFKAWQDQDYSVRDYRPYFKPVLCYLEGKWTNSSDDSIDEPFESNLHSLSAENWLKLQDQVRFNSYAGTKNRDENVAFLPTKVMYAGTDTSLVIGQWNYDILCHALKDDLPLSELQPVDDLKSRMIIKNCPDTGCSMDDYRTSRLARFQVARESGGSATDLDELMNQIPGHDNYRGVLNETVFGQTSRPINPPTADSVLNTAFYHRMYSVSDGDDMGRLILHRGFSDDTLFMAQTTDPKIAGMTMEDCSDGTCKTISQKWTYAIPLEIIYLNPLQSWNPYDLVTRDGNDGKDGTTEATALTAVNDKDFYMTPDSFYLDQENADPADKLSPVRKWVVNPDGTANLMSSSGIWISIPEIPGVGRLRQRYPIMPLYGEGSAMWKELEALKDITMEPIKFVNLFREDVSQCSSGC